MIFVLIKMNGVKALILNNFGGGKKIMTERRNTVMELEFVDKKWEKL